MRIKRYLRYVGCLHNIRQKRQPRSRQWAKFQRGLDLLVTPAIISSGMQPSPPRGGRPCLIKSEMRARGRRRVERLAWAPELTGYTDWPRAVLPHEHCSKLSNSAGCLSFSLGSLFRRFTFRGISKLDFSLGIVQLAENMKRSDGLLRSPFHIEFCEITLKGRKSRQI